MKGKRELREAIVQAVMQRRGCGREEAETIMRRIADRLEGYSSAEARARHPLPRERDEACGTL